MRCQGNGETYNVLDLIYAVLMHNVYNMHIDVALTHEGRLLLNNSVISLDALGFFNASTTNPLFCVTTLSSCCDTNRRGNWFPPDSASHLGTFPNTSHLHQSWEDDQSIQLLRSSRVASIEGGLYHCEIPDRNNIMRALYVGIYPSPNNGTFICLDDTMMVIFLVHIMHIIIEGVKMMLKITYATTQVLCKSLH